MRTLVIIPAFNEVENVPYLIHQIIDLGYDYVVINDCSTDNSESVYKELEINHLDLPLNMGLASVTQIGFKYAYEHNYDSAIVIDGDGQHLPVYIKPLLDAVAEGYDYVVGSRFVSEKKPWSMRMAGSRIICFFIYLKTGIKVTDPTSGMRAMGKNVMQEFADGMNFVAEPDALCHILKEKKKYKEIQVHMKEREHGTSYFVSPFKSIKFMIDVLISIIFIQ